MSSRREFAALLAAALAPRRAGAAAIQPRLLAQVYVFTQEFERRKLPLKDGIDEIFATTRDAGFRGIELMASLFAPGLREATVRSAKQHGITVPVVYCGGAMHTPEGGARTVAASLAVAAEAEAVGATAINHNPDPIGRAKSGEELRVQAGNLNRLGEALRVRGQMLLVHHHNPEMAGGAREWRHILQNTDPAAVSLCVDTHWAHRGGQDPWEIVREGGARVQAIHLRNSTGGVWQESFAAGDLDYRRLAALLTAEKRTPALVVELAYEDGTRRTRSLRENLRAAREHAERVFGLTAA